MIKAGLSIGSCRLCGEKRRLRRSHVIPKFVVKWLKATSATGFVRQGVNRNKRSQDTQKVNLLCDECEGRFSRWEKQFAQKIFYPFHDGTLEPVEYDTWLLKFVVSVSWRGFVTTSHLLPAARLPSWAEVAQRWEKYLLDESPDPGPNAHHLFLSGATGQSDIQLPAGWNLYGMRSVDMTPACSQTEAFMYTNLPGVVLCSWVEPADPRGWINTKVESRGRIADQQVVHHQGFIEFAVRRVSELAGVGAPLSERQKQVTRASIEGNPKRVAESETLRMVQLDQRLTTGSSQMQRDER
jgi:hypothetical protein